MAAMASTSMNLTTTFIGLAKLQKTSIAGNHVPRMWRTITFRHRGFATTSRSIHPPFAAVSLSRAKRLSRNLSVAATAAPTQQDEDYEDSDVFTKIPPDNRIPATIITGFLGSGKVIISSCIWISFYDVDAIIVYEFVAQVHIIFIFLVFAWS